MTARLLTDQQNAELATLTVLRNAHNEADAAALLAMLGLRDDASEEADCPQGSEPPQPEPQPEPERRPCAECARPMVSLRQYRKTAEWGQQGYVPHVAHGRCRSCTDKAAPPKRPRQHRSSEDR